MISEQLKRYCKDYQNIENYDLAIADKNEMWECHHKLETETSDGIKRPRKAQLTYKELIALNIYYNRPSSELIFLTRKEHFLVHRTIESDKDFGSEKEDKKAYKKAYSNAYYESHKNERKAYGKAYRESHKDEIKAYNESHKDELKANKKSYRESHKDEIKSYRESHKDEKKAYNKAYRESHKDEINCKKRIRSFIKRKGIVTDLSLLPKKWTNEDIEYYKNKYLSA